MKFLLFFLLAFLLIPISSAFAQKIPFEIPGPNGKLVGEIQRPDKAEKVPLVIISHGFTANKEGTLLTDVADALEKVGIASIRFDFDGHGESGGDFQDMTVPKEINDLKAIYSYALNLPYVESISLLGHSQGGVVTSMVAGDLGNKKIKAIVLMAPAAILREDAIRGNTMGVTYDPLNPPEYVELPMPGKTLRLGREYIRTAFDLPIFETAEGYRGPACMIHGTGDQIVPYTMSLHYDHRFKKSELHLIPGEDHGFNKNRSEAVKIAVDFLSAQLLK